MLRCCPVSFSAYTELTAYIKLALQRPMLLRACATLLCCPVSFSATGYSVLTRIFTVVATATTLFVYLLRCYAIMGLLSNCVYSQLLSLRPLALCLCTFGYVLICTSVHRLWNIGYVLQGSVSFSGSRT